MFVVLPTCVAMLRHGICAGASSLITGAPVEPLIGNNWALIGHSIALIGHDVSFE